LGKIVLRLLDEPALLSAAPCLSRNLPVSGPSGGSYMREFTGNRGPQWR